MSAAALDAADPLLAWRDEFPILPKKRGYLINNSLGAMPKRTEGHLRAFTEIWAEEGVLAWHDWMPRVVETGDLVGRLIGAPKGAVVMHQNVATCTQMVLSCMQPDSGRNRIVCTDLNFPSVPYNFHSLGSQGLEVISVPGSGPTVDVQRVVDAIDERTLLVSLDLVLFRSGALLDVKPAIEKAHRVGALVVVDGYQASGAVPIDVVAMDCDFFMGGSVKWLCGGPGAAYLYVKPALWGSLRPRMNGWFSHEKPFAFEVGPIRYAEDIHRFMGGSPSVPALYSARGGYEVLAEVGIPAIRAKSERLTARMVELADAQGLTVNTPRDPAQRGGTVCVDFEGSEAAHHELIKRGWVIDWRPACGIRVSPHFYNQASEVEGIFEAIRELRAGR